MASTSKPLNIRVAWRFGSDMLQMMHCCGNHGSSVGDVARTWASWVVYKGGPSCAVLSTPGGASCTAAGKATHEVVVADIAGGMGRWLLACMCAHVQPLHLVRKNAEVVRGHVQPEASDAHVIVTSSLLLYTAVYTVYSTKRP